MPQTSANTAIKKPGLKNPKAPSAVSTIATMVRPAQSSRASAPTYSPKRSDL
jgi:hypothetical protein